MLHSCLPPLASATGGKPHSYVMDPIICAAMSIAHPGAPHLRAKYGPTVFDGAVSEVLSVLQSPQLQKDPRVSHYGSIPHVHADDRNLLVDLLIRTETEAGGAGHFQFIENDLGLMEAAEEASLTAQLDVIPVPAGERAIMCQFGGRREAVFQTAQPDVIPVPAGERHIMCQFGRGRSRGPPIQAVTCVQNAIPDTVSIPLHLCHPILCGGDVTSCMGPGTAFQLLMGPKRQKMVRGVYVSPSEWYIEGLSRPRVEADGGVVYFDFKKYPGSHIPLTKTDPTLWATMCLTRIEEPKVFDAMIRKIDSRIVREIHRRIHLADEAQLDTVVSLCPSQFGQVGGGNTNDRWRCCSTCGRRFASVRGYERHACVNDAEEMRLHCAICDKTYATQGYLDRHIATAHGGRTTTRMTHHDRLEHTAQPNAPLHPEHGSSVPIASPFVVVDQPNGGMRHPPLHSEHRAPVPAVASPFVIVDCSNGIPTATAPIVCDAARRIVMFDEDPDGDEMVSKSDDYAAPEIQGITGVEILAIANTWSGPGQEFEMTYKEKNGSEKEKEYEVHGMLLRWDMSGRKPGPVVCYPGEEQEQQHCRRKKRSTTLRYCEEHLDCTDDNFVLRLEAIPPTSVFDSKRRKMNQ